MRAPSVAARPVITRAVAALVHPACGSAVRAASARPTATREDSTSDASTESSPPTAWKAINGLPNCSRVRTCSMVCWSARSNAPWIAAALSSAASARRVCASPSRTASGVMPETTRSSRGSPARLRPSRHSTSPAGTTTRTSEPSVRCATATTRLASRPHATRGATPSSTPPPSRRSPPSTGSAIVMTSEPEGTSAPALAIARPARTVSATGSDTLARARPVTIVTTSASVPPSPPRSSSTPTPCQPRDVTIFHVSAVRSPASPPSSSTTSATITARSSPAGRELRVLRAMMVCSTSVVPPRIVKPGAACTPCARRPVAPAASGSVSAASNVRATSLTSRSNDVPRSLSMAA